MDYPEDPADVRPVDHVAVERLRGAIRAARSHGGDFDDRLVDELIDPRITWALRAVVDR